MDISTRKDALLTTLDADDETNMKELESNMRGIDLEGLTWGASKLVPVGYGISKLQVNVSPITQKHYSLC